MNGFILHESMEPYKRKAPIRAYNESHLHSLLPSLSLNKDAREWHFPSLVSQPRASSLSTSINPLLPDGKNRCRIGKILLLKMKRSGKKFYERRVYESENDKSLSYIERKNGVILI